MTKEIKITGNSRFENLPYYETDKIYGKLHLLVSNNRNLNSTTVLSKADDIRFVLNNEIVPYLIHTLQRINKKPFIHLIELLSGTIVGDAYIDALMVEFTSYENGGFKSLSYCKPFVINEHPSNYVLPSPHRFEASFLRLLKETYESEERQKPQVTETEPVATIDKITDWTTALNAVDKLLEADRGYGLLYKEIDMFEDIHNGLDIAKDMNEYLYKIYHLAVNPAKAITKEEFEEERNRRNQDTLSSEIEYYGEDC